MDFRPMRDEVVFQEIEFLDPLRVAVQALHRQCEEIQPEVGTANEISRRLERPAPEVRAAVRLRLQD